MFFNIARGVSLLLLLTVAACGNLTGAVGNRCADAEKMGRIGFQCLPDSTSRVSLYKKPSLGATIAIRHLELLEKPKSPEVLDDLRLAMRVISPDTQRGDCETQMRPMYIRGLPVDVDRCDSKRHDVRIMGRIKMGPAGNRRDVMVIAMVTHTRNAAEYLKDVLLAMSE